ncbi:hypothetical protein CALVIDRAFT_561550 [Calocera viscosa TUFC12733]|uniref:Uncharacterized protein n=1 Tax=Calocera viscosa (strain TUFC12733) TaxID=1330018 RepID=A0A167PV58_CALVF|nr:hypothetical protein CALVIDRAFT_561550 [Calocera viscosa TUFC12733]
MPGVGLNGDIAALPNELLSMVFESYVASWETDVNAAWGELWKFLSTVGRVSMHWRDISLGTPLLWRNIFYGDNEEYCPADEHLPGDIQTWLTRSSESPICLWVLGLARVRELDDLLATPAKNRVRDIHLYLESELIPPPPASEEPAPIPPTIPLRTSWPALKHLSLSMRQGIESARGLANLISKLTTIETLHIEGWPTGPFVPPPEAALLPHLRSIQLVDVYAFDCGMILSCFTAPRLRTMSMMLISGEEEGLPATLTAACAFNLANVRELSLLGRLRAVILQSILRAAPCTTTLSLAFKDRQHSAFTHVDFLRVTATTTIDMIYVPALEELKIDHQMFWVNPLMPIVQSRMELPTVSSLKKIGVPLEFEMSYAQMLVPLRALGVEVVGWIPDSVPYFLDKRRRI